MKNESVKKSPDKSKNVLEEEREKGQAKNLHKKDQHVYNNYYELRSRAINNNNKSREKNSIENSKRLRENTHTRPQ